MFTSDPRSAAPARKRWLLLVAALLGTTSASPSPDGAPLRAWLADAAQDRFVEIAFLQERTVPSMDKPVATEGRFVRYQGDAFLWELGSPPETILRFDGTTLTLEDTVEGETEKLSPSDPRIRPIFRFATAHDPDAFFKTFFLLESSVSGGVYIASLKPRNPTFARQVEAVFLQIDPATNSLKTFELRQKSGARTLIRFAKPVVK